uniref:FRIGIDA-like protein n=1 Tax=Nelumbo nucifera TaxID=4432 RepID=A0A822XIR0_NELNU|nr:TPA_asm: hypothetical protein HUJ06_021743 [Nelumbo nucifera]
MSSTKAISASLKSVDAKKESLRKAFEDLQSHSSSLASFTLQWKDLEDHFDSIQKSLEHRFKELEAKEAQVSAKGSAPKQSPPEKDKSADKPSPHLPAKKPDEPERSPRPELKSLCVSMDGMGLRSYIIEHRKELPFVKDELAGALRTASDPATLVLDAMQGFFPPNSKGDKDGELASIRRTCILLLEQSAAISPEIRPHVKEKAKNLAHEWKGKVSKGGENPLEALGFLQLLATYGLGSAFNADELLDLVATVARRRQAVDLCRAIGFSDKIPDFIEKLKNNGKHLEAVKFVFAFELVDKFPPVPLLKAHVKASKKVAQEIRKKGNDSIQAQNEASAKEIAALKAVIKYIEDHKLESEYPRESLDKRIEQMEKQKSDRKRPAATPAQKPQSQQQQTGNKRPRPAVPAPPRTLAAATSVPSIQQAQLQQPSLLQDRFTPYLSSTAGPYGLASPSTVTPYMSSTGGLYGLAGGKVGLLVVKSVVL